MTTAFMNLYDYTNGQSWYNRRNWSIGEPCIDNWYGVYCCPVTMPYIVGPLYSPTEQRCSATPSIRRQLEPGWHRKLSHEAVTNINLQLVNEAGAGEHFCSSGVSYGDDRDLAVCTPVMVILDSNNLDGPLDFFVDSYPNPSLRQRGFSDLQAFSVQNNYIRGTWPTWLEGLPMLSHVRFALNQFDLTDSNQNAMASFCNRPGVDCSDSGLPAYNDGSCFVFGRETVLLEPYSARCHVCEDSGVVSRNWYLLLFLPLMIILVIYVGLVWNAAKGGRGFAFVRCLRCTMSHGATLKRGVACSAVFIMHYQTIVLIGTVLPFWPNNIQSILSYMSFSYSAFTMTACMVGTTTRLVQNLEAQSNVNTVLLTVMIAPPLLILFNTALKSLMKLLRRKELEKGMTSHDTGALACLNKISNFLFRHIADYIPNIEFVSSVLMVTLLGNSLKVGKELIMWSATSGSPTFTAIFGAVLVCLQPTVWMLYGRDAAIAQRDRKESVLHEAGIPKDTFRVTYLTEPFKERAASYQLIILAQQAIVFFAAWMGNYREPTLDNINPTMQVVSHLIIYPTLFFFWSVHTVIEPWDSAYMNAMSSRLYFFEISMLFCGDVWNAYHRSPVMGALMDFLLHICVLFMPIFTIIYLLIALRATRTSIRLFDGVVSNSVPIWIRGMRWEELDLPKYTVAIASIHAGCPTAHSVHEALQKAVGEKGQSTEGGEMKRVDDFTAAFDKLLKELSIGFSSSNLSAQVRKYGAEATMEAQIESLDQAKARVLKQLEAFGVKLEGGPADEVAPPPSPISRQPTQEEKLEMERQASESLSSRPSSRNRYPVEVTRSDASRAALAKLPSSIRAEDEQEDYPSAITSRPSDLTKQGGSGFIAGMPTVGAPAEVTNDDVQLEMEPEIDDGAGVGGGPPAAAPAPAAAADASEEAPAPAPILAEPSLDDDDDDGASPPPSPPLTPPSPPPSPGGPERRASWTLPDGTVLTGENRQGLAGGTCLQRAASRSGAALSRGQSRGLAGDGLLGQSRGLAGDGLLERGASRPGIERGQSRGLVGAEGLLTRGASGIQRRPSGVGGLARGTSLQRGMSRSAALGDGTLLQRGTSRSTGLGAGTSLTRGESRARALGAGTALTRGESRSQAIGQGTVLTRGESRSQHIGAGTVACTGESHTRSIADGTIMTRGESRSQHIGAGTAAFDGVSHVQNINHGTIMTRGESRSQHIGAGTAAMDGLSHAQNINHGTIMTRGESMSSSITDGTIMDPHHPGLKGKKRLEHYGAAVQNMNRIAGRKCSVYTVLQGRRASVGKADPSLFKLEDRAVPKGMFHIPKPKLKRSLSEQEAGQAKKGIKPTLERSPIEPPPVPSTDTSASLPTRGASRKQYFISQLEWLVSPAEDVTQAKQEVSAWPREANRLEPGFKQLDSQMVAVLSILERANFGVGDSIGGDSGVVTKPLVELGYSVRVCCHHHRDARTYSTRAAILRQNWFLQLVDLRAVSETEDRFIVIPNEYLGQWAGRRLRVREPFFAGGPNARGSNELVKLVKQGQAIVYDTACTSAIALPFGVRAKVIHHSIDLDPAGQRYIADHAVGDIGAMRRALGSGRDSAGKVSTIYDSSLADLVLEPGCSAGILLEDLSNLVQDLSKDGSINEAVPSAELCATLRFAMRDLCRELTEDGVTFKKIAGSFPKIVRAGMRGVSVHLCISETRRLAPDTSREVTVWLTIVDLDKLNPVNTAMGGPLTPKKGENDRRSSYVVKGELAMVRSLEEIETEERRQVFELEAELKRLRTGRLARARAARASDSGPSPRPLGGGMASGSARDFLKGMATPASLESTASKLAIESAGPSAADYDSEDERDAKAAKDMEKEVRQIRQRRESKSEGKKADLGV